MPQKLCITHTCAVVVCVVKGADSMRALLSTHNPRAGVHCSRGSWFVFSDSHLSMLEAGILLGLGLWSRWCGVGENTLVLGSGYKRFHLSCVSLLGLAIGCLLSYSQPLFVQL